MKATVILIGLVVMALLALLGGATGVVARVTPTAVEPVWMMLSGASLIALGSAVRGHRP